MNEEHIWLNRLFGDHPTAKNIELAKFMGTTESTISKIRNGNRRLRFEEINKIREFFNVIDKSADTANTPAAISPLTLNGKSYAGRAISLQLPTPTQSAFVMDITTRDMAPTLNQDDYLILDANQTSFDGAGLYVINHDGHPIIRHIEPNFDQAGHVDIMADNGAIKKHTVKPDQIAIIGKGVFIGKFI